MENQTPTSGPPVRPPINLPPPLPSAPPSPGPPVRPPINSPLPLPSASPSPLLSPPPHRESAMENQPPTSGPSVRPPINFPRPLSSASPSPLLSPPPHRKSAMENQPPTSGPSVRPPTNLWIPKWRRLSTTNPVRVIRKQPPTSRQVDPVPLHAPIHFQIPMGRDQDILLAVDGSGKTMQIRMRRDPDILVPIGRSGKNLRLPSSLLGHHPCERSATMPDAVSSFGEGPLILVEVDVDGNYFTRTNLPSCVFRSCPSMQEIINKVCSTMGRPLPFSYQQHYLCGGDFVASLVIPPRLDIIANCLSSPCMFTLHLHNWGIAFYIRVDLDELYHIYPNVEGPFETLQEAYSAIQNDLEARKDPRMFMRQPNDSQVDYVVRQCLHWPDGTRKKRLKSEPIDEIRDHKRHLVQALVDKYNDYLGDTAYVLKDVVQYTSVRLPDCRNITKHINFTARAKGTEDSDCSMDDLFFAEVTTKIGDDKLVVSCFCRVKTTDNGYCYGCNAKHPNAAVYSRGEVGASPFGGPHIDRTVVEEDLEAEERRVRRYYENQGLDKPGYFDKLRAIMR